jgi:CheY-like chemotaxis protein
MALLYGQNRCGNLVAMDLTAKNLGLTRRFTQPVVEATRETFESFLNIPVKLTGMTEFRRESPFDVNMAIDVSGAGHGSLVLSVTSGLACRAAGAMLFQEFGTADGMVLDFVGELANMIGGSAKKQLDFLGFRLGLPEPVTQDRLAKRFPPHSFPITLNFESESGNLAIHAAFVGAEDQHHLVEVGVLPHLLIVDDDPIILRIMRRLLHDNYRITSMTSLHDGLEFARKSPPDALLTDIHTPDWNGLEFAAAVRSEAGLTETPIVMLTGDDSRESVLAAFDAGADDYILKTDFTRVALLGKLKRAIDSRHQSRLPRRSARA